MDALIRWAPTINEYCFFFFRKQGFSLALSFIDSLSKVKTQLCTFGSPTFFFFFGKKPYFVEIIFSTNFWEDFVGQFR